MALRKEQNKLTREEFDWLTRLEKGIDHAWNDLTAFEQRFMEDHLERFRRYGINTIITKPQWSVITEISDKIIT